MQVVAAKPTIEQGPTHAGDSLNHVEVEITRQRKHATAEQAWLLSPESGYWTIRDATSGTAIDGLGRTAHGAKVGYRPPTGAPSQRWELVEVGGGWSSLRNLTTRMCLDVRQQAAGTVIRQWGCEAANGDQHWRLALP